MADKTPTDALRGIAAPESTESASPAASPGTPSSAAAPASGGVAGMGTTLRDDIRGQLQRDLAAASKRIDDRMSQATEVSKQPHVKASCWACHGTSRCWWCKGAGCHNCFGGACPTCRGSGSV